MPSGVGMNEKMGGGGGSCPFVLGIVKKQPYGDPAKPSIRIAGRNSQQIAQQIQPSELVVIDVQLG